MPACSMRPLLISTTWSAMVMASVWSCVTYTMVMPEALLQGADLAAHLAAQLRVEVGERLVHQAHRPLGDDGAAERHALLLAAGELARACAPRSWPRPSSSATSRQALRALRGAATLRTSRPKTMFSLDGEVREERVGLEHHRDAALRRGHVGHVAPADEERARRSASPARRSGAAWWTCRSRTGPAARRTSPAAASKLTASTARTLPQCLETFSRRIADTGEQTQPEPVQQQLSPYCRSCATSSATTRCWRCG